MAKLKLKLDLDNDSFLTEDGHLDYTSISDAVTRAAERIDRNLHNGEREGPLVDMNGNKCGSWSVK